MKEFIYNLLSEKGKISSKRFIAVFSLMLFTIVIIAQLKGINVPAELYYSLVTLITSNSALTLMQKNNNETDESK